MGITYVNSHYNSLEDIRNYSALAEKRQSVIELIISGTNEHTAYCMVYNTGGSNSMCNSDSNVSYTIGEIK